jgi:hypothetical protein
MNPYDFTLKVFSLPILATGALCAFAWPAAAAQPANSAFGIDTRFETKGMATHLGPIGFVSHSNNGAYDKTVHVGSVNETAPIVAQPVAPTIFINASGINSEVKSSSIEVDSETTQASTSIDRTALMLNLNPLPPGSVAVPQPYLQVLGSGISSQANFNTVFPSLTSATGSSSVRSLKITGSLVGTSPLTYSGSAPPNTVIYDSPTVTITLNKQIKEEVISCTVPGGCVTKVYAITVDAVDISLNKADVDGYKVSGDIVVGESQAQ